MKKYWTITANESQGNQTASVDKSGAFSFLGTEAFSFETKKAAEEILTQVEKENANNPFLSFSLSSYEN